MNLMGFVPFPVSYSHRLVSYSHRCTPIPVSYSHRLLRLARIW